MFIFDYIIGNRDRHLGNFSLTEDFTLAPLYDNAASMCYGLSERHAQSLLEEGNYKELHAYSFDIKAHACIPHRCSNVELMFYIKEHYTDIWGELIQPFLALQPIQFQNVLN